MKRLISALLLSITVCCSLAAQQNLTILKRIATDINSHSGLGQSFRGRVLDDGNLYFRGSQTGHHEEFWKSNGTTSGTILLQTEPNSPTWSVVHYLSDGILYTTSADEYRWFNAPSNQTVSLGILPDLNMRGYRELDDENIFFYGQQGDSLELWQTNKTQAGTVRLGTLGIQDNFVSIYASAFGAVAYSTNSFGNFVPVFYESATGDMHDIRAYLSPHKTFSKIQAAFLYDHILFIRGIEDGFIRNYIFDLAEQQFYPSAFFRDDVSFVEYGDDIILISDREIMRYDRPTHAIVEITGDLFTFSDYLVDGDRIYIVMDNTENELSYLDLTSNIIHTLPDADIGNNHYDIEIRRYKDEIYFTQDDGTSIYLKKYTLATNQTSLVDTIAVNNGAYSIANGLEVVNDELIVSHYRLGQGHELFYLSNITPTREVALAEMVVFPNPAEQSIHFESLCEHVQLWNSTGVNVINTPLHDTELHIAHLAPGIYAGIVTNNTGSYRISFIKK